MRVNGVRGLSGCWFSSPATREDQLKLHCIVLPRLICGQLIEHCKPSNFRGVQPSSVLQFSREIRLHSLVTLLRGPRLSYVVMGFE